MSRRLTKGRDDAVTVASELRQIYQLWTEAAALGQRCALATVVSVEGSSYRFPGARMLIVASGAWSGTVSGGCLEADVVAHGLAVIASGEPRCVLYDTTDQADLVLGFGMGCRGKIHVLIERLEEGGAPLQFLASCLEERREGVLGTVFYAAKDHPWLRLGAHFFSPHAAAPALPGRAWVQEQLRQTLAERRSRVVASGEGDSATTILWEYVKPAPSLLICGAGHDALALVQAVEPLSWHLEVLDARPAYLTRERFPKVQACHLWQTYPVPPSLAWSEASATAVLVMTHNFERDLHLLPWLLTSPAAYVGLLGPLSRTKQLLDQLRRDGLEFSEAQLSRLYAPVGLDIGADSPAEIALAIVAEIQAVLSGYRAGFLRDRRGPIHLHQDRVLTTLKHAGPL